MYERFHTYTIDKPRLRKTVAWTLVVVGFIALVTPLTPGGFLFFVGLELLGLRYIWANRFDRLKTRFGKKAQQELSPIHVPSVSSPDQSV